MNVKKTDKVVNEIDMIVSKWPEFADEVDVNSELTDKTNETLISFK